MSVTTNPNGDPLTNLLERARIRLRIIYILGEHADNYPEFRQQLLRQGEGRDDLGEEEKKGIALYVYRFFFV